MKTGDIVKIQGGYFKSDNGIFKIIHSPGDKNWSGKDWCLYRCNKDLSISKSKYKTAFWPLMITISSNQKYLLARKHNLEHATIEIIKENGKV